MLERDHVVSLLRVNGIKAGADDAEIREVLTQARWHHDDIEQAIALMHSDEAAELEGVSERGYSKNTFYLPKTMRPETLSALLGVTVNVPKRALDDSEVQYPDERGSLELSEYLMIVGGSVLVAAILGVTILYFLKLGPFYTPIA